MVDHDRSEPADEVTGASLTIRENGPLVIDGPVTIIDETGERVETRMFLCRCGASNSKPRCDGSHKKNGFTAPGQPVPQKP